MLHRFASLLVTLLSAVLVALVAVQPAHAETVTWSVTPADESGPNKRAWVEHEINPGEQAVDYAAVTNHSTSAVTFDLYAADGYFTAAGRFNMKPAAEEPVDSGAWISIPSTVEVGPGATVVIPFEINVPDNATPGDHAAGVAASIKSQRDSDDGTAMSVESRVGFRVMTRVAGEVQASLAISTVDSSYRTSWNPFTAGSIDVIFSVVNNGNVAVSAEAIAAASGASAVAEVGTGAEEGSASTSLLPGATMTFSARVPDVWPTFVTAGEVRVSAHAVDGNEIITDVDPFETFASFSSFTMPWPQLFVLLGLFLIVGAFLVRRKAVNRRIDLAHAAGREEGRREKPHTPGEDDPSPALSQSGSRRSEFP